MIHPENKVVGLWMRASELTQWHCFAKKFIPGLEKHYFTPQLGHRDDLRPEFNEQLVGANYG